MDPWRFWRARGFWNRFFWPVSVLYCAVTAARRRLYEKGILRVCRVSRPVIVVGNITVGGTGKTPFVVWLCAQLQASGRRPGVALRGYGGLNRALLEVRPTTDPAIAGDEAVLLARRTGHVVVVCADRVAAARALIARGCDVVVCDDGLQHYRLGRTLEIGILDGVRRFGNEYCLPSGPLRERRARWEALDFRVTQGAPGPGEWAMRLEGTVAYAVGGGEAPIPVARLGRVHGVAGIGNPQRFFAYLRHLGLEVVAHAFPDHHTYVREDLDFADGDSVVMTEKDAVKCEAFARPGWWYVPVTAVVDTDLARRIVARLA